MKPFTHRVLQILADGDFHSGEAVARALGVSRGTVWHAVADLQQAGLDLYQVRGRGYRLVQPVSLIDAAAVRRHLGEVAQQLEIEFADSIGSTNTALMDRAQHGAPHGSVLVAEWQSAGRGRQGRPWRASVGGALTFSMLWRFARGANDLAGLSLAVGVALARALEACGVAAIGLKWPNDVLWRGRKLAGILIEMHGDILGPTASVIGIGVNVRLGEAAKREIDQPAADLETAIGGAVDRSAALAGILKELALALAAFGEGGFSVFRREWMARHVHQDQPVTVKLAGARREHGVARGVGEDGALLVDTGSGTRRYHSGDVSVRGGSTERVRA